MTQVITHASRRNGRAHRFRTMTDQAATEGEHVHVAGTDGLWCVSRHPLGYLYAKVYR